MFPTWKWRITKKIFMKLNKLRKKWRWKNYHWLFWYLRERIEFHWPLRSHTQLIFYATGKYELTNTVKMYFLFRAIETKNLHYSTLFSVFQKNDIRTITIWFRYKIKQESKSLWKLVKGETSLPSGCNHIFILYCYQYCPWGQSIAIIQECFLITSRDVID